MVLYNLVPAVDGEYQFPPEVLAALFSSDEFLEAISGLGTGGGGGGGDGSGADGPRGLPGEGVGAQMLGEASIDYNSQNITGTVSTNWNDFNKVVTEGTKDIYVSLGCHIQTDSATTITIGVLRDGVVIGAWNRPIPAGQTGIAHWVHCETVSFDPVPGNHTYQVQLRSSVNGPTIKGVATADFKAVMRIMEL